MDNAVRYIRDMYEWKKRNNIPNSAKKPKEKPEREPGEGMYEYVLRLTRYYEEVKLWKTAPNVFDYGLVPTIEDFKDYSMKVYSKCYLKSWLGCGVMLKGMTVGNEFRPKDVYGYEPLDPRSTSHVEYLFFTIFYFPIIPLGCYRINNGNRIIMAKEKWKISEVIWLYIQTLITIIACLWVFGFALSD